MRAITQVVLAGVGVAAGLASACGGPCQQVEAARLQLTQRPAVAAVEPHARVRVPFQVANRAIAEALAEPPEVPVSLRRLGPLRRLVGELHAVPRSVTLSPAGPGKLRVAFTVELRDQRGELVTFDGHAEVEPVLQHTDTDAVLSIGIDRIKAARIPPASHLRELEQIFAYNALVARLDEDLTPAYLEMLEAHVHYAAAATAKPYVVSTATATRKARSDAAQKVVAAWLAFDHALAESDALAGDPAALNAFTLDDAVLSQALFFYAEAHDDRGQEIPLDPKNPPPVRLPVFFDGYAAPAAKKPGAGFAPTAAPRPADQQALRLRVAAAPIRIRWARRLEPLLGKTTQDVLAKEEAERFRALEQRLHDLTTSYVEVRKAAAGTVDLTSEAAKQRLATHAATAARAAADMGLWRLDDPSAPIGQRERKPFATTILDAAVTAGATIDARTQAAVVEAQRKRRLRFL